MRDEQKTPQQLLEELAGMRQRLSVLEASEASRRESEEALSRQTAVLEAINRVFQETLVCDNEAEVAGTCLTVAEELTDSRFGFIGEVNPAGRFDTMALSNPGWEECQIPGSEAALLIKNMEIRGLWGRVLQDEQSLIVNDPASHPDRVGTPAGHPPLTSFLGVPLKQRGQTIGMIGVANKEVGYSPGDREAVEKLSIAFVEALMRKRAEEEIRTSQERLEERVAERTAELESANERLQREFAERQRAEETIQRQAEEILEIATPVLQVWEGVVVAPLVGTLDRTRTYQFMERLLQGIVETNSSVALIDITGVPVIDTQTAHHLIKTINAVRLMGGQVILTGLRPPIALSLVDLGFDLADVVTTASLSAGIRLALEMLGLQINPQKGTPPDQKTYRKPPGEEKGTSHATREIQAGNDPRQEPHRLSRTGEDLPGDGDPTLRDLASSAGDRTRSICGRDEGTKGPMG